MASAAKTKIREKTLFVIDGDVTLVQEIVTRKQVSTADFAARLASLQPLDSGLLPKNCIWMRRAVAKNAQVRVVWAMYYPAGLYNILWTDHKGIAPETKTLAWPATVWTVRADNDIISGVNVGAVKVPLDNLELSTPLFELPMPNQFADGRICTGQVITTAGSIQARAADLVDRVIFRSTWNHDLMPNLADVGISSIQDWADKTAAHGAAFAQMLTFQQHDARTFGALMTKVTGEANNE